MVGILENCYIADGSNNALMKRNNEAMLIYVHSIAEKSLKRFVFSQMKMRMHIPPVAQRNYLTYPYIIAKAWGYILFL